MVLGGTVPPPHILGPTLYCIFSTVKTVIGLCLATKSVDLWRNLCTIVLYSIVHVRCRRKESSRSLSHLLRFLYYTGLYEYRVAFRCGLTTDLRLHIARVCARGSLVELHPWTDDDQTFTICTPLLMASDVGRRCGNGTALLANQEALPLPMPGDSQLVTRSTRHTVNSSQVNSSPGRLVTRSTRHKEAVNSSQANKQANIKAVLPQQYNYPYP